MAYDNACKYLSEKYPVQFANWILGENYPIVKVLKTELSPEPIRADYLTFLQTQERILHIEFEVDGDGTPPVPLRMLDYWVRLHRRYNIPISQTVILLKETAASRKLKDTFRQENTRHRYQIIRMWEQDPKALLENPALLPLASLCYTADPEQLLAQVAQELTKIETSAERGQIAACTEILAGLRFDKNLIREFLREDIMRESVIYQDILQQGVQRGIQQGLQQGQKQSLKTSIVEALEIRFGVVSAEISQRLNQLTNEQLQGLHRQAIICGSLEEFISQLG